MAGSSGSSSTTSSRTGTFLLALVVAVGVIAGAYIYQTSSAEASSKAKAKAKSVGSGVGSAPASVSKKPSVEVEDDEDDDEDEEDEGEAKARQQKEEEAKQQKDRYDGCMSVADKCVKGNDHARAIQKYTEALEIAPFVPSATRAIPTIYNNRSAMHEKLGQFPQSLGDIDTLLAVDPYHVKARVRRARIFEAQDKLQESMQEFCTAMLIERFKATDQAAAAANSANHEEKIAALSKVLSNKRAGPILDAIRNSPGRELPTTAFCRNFFDVLPSPHKWRATLSKAKGLDALTAALEALGKEADNIAESLDVACCAIADGKYKTAFKVLATARDEAPSEEADGSSSEQLSRHRALQLYLSGLEKHLRCNLAGAVVDYAACVAADKDGRLYEAKLALAFAFRELGKDGEAEGQYAEIFALFVAQLEREALKGATMEEGQIAEPAFPLFRQFLLETGSGAMSSVALADLAAELASAAPAVVVDIAWTLVHRHSLWTTRNAAGSFRPLAVDLSQQDLALVEALLSPMQANASVDSETRASATMCSVLHSIKQISLLTQTKAQASVSPATFTMSDEEKLQCHACVAKAKALAPTHESVLVLESDMLAMDERLDEALEVTDRMIARADRADGVPNVLKANIFAQQVWYLRSRIGQLAFPLVPGVQPSLTSLPSFSPPAPLPSAGLPPSFWHAQ